MKSKVIKFISLILFSAILFIPLISFRADSGWDVDYDSGGSYSSDSSWSSSDWGYSSSGDSDLTFGDFIVIVVMLIIVFVEVYNVNKNKANKTVRTNNTYKLTQEQVNEVDNTIVIKDIVKKCFDLYTKVQYSWSQFDYKNLEKLLSNELYNNYKMQLETLSLKNQKNLMEDITFVDGSVKSVSLNGNKEEVVITLKIKMKDYVIDVNTNNVVRGSDAYHLEVTYNITLTRNIKENVKFCPGCGASIKNTAHEKCEYCGTVIVNNNTEFVMSKKECINQRRTK